jgi:hypothetical protein
MAGARDRRRQRQWPVMGEQTHGAGLRARQSMHRSGEAASHTRGPRRSLCRLTRARRCGHGVPRVWHTCTRQTLAPSHGCAWLCGCPHQLRDNTPRTHATRPDARTRCTCSQRTSPSTQNSHHTGTGPPHLICLTVKVVQRAAWRPWRLRIDTGRAGDELMARHAGPPAAAVALLALTALLSVGEAGFRPRCAHIGGFWGLCRPDHPHPPGP